MTRDVDLTSQVCLGCVGFSSMLGPSFPRLSFSDVSRVRRRPFEATGCVACGERAFQGCCQARGDVEMRTARLGKDWHCREEQMM